MNDHINVVEAQMQVGAKVQKFYDMLREYRNDFKEWHPEDDSESEVKKAKEELLFSIMDDYCSLFEKILA